MSNHIRQQMNSSTELDLADINTEETSLKNIDPNLDATIKKIKILTVNESYIPSLRALGYGGGKNFRFFFPIFVGKNFNFFLTPSPPQAPTSAPSQS